MWPTELPRALLRLLDGKQGATAQVTPQKRGRDAAVKVSRGHFEVFGDKQECSRETWRIARKTDYEIRSASTRFLHLGPGFPVQLEEPLGTRGRKGITIEDVRAACERLVLQGRTVGPINVRLELGGRGGYGTITRHLETLGYSGKGRAAKDPKKS